MNRAISVCLTAFVFLFSNASGQYLNLNNRIVTSEVQSTIPTKNIIKNNDCTIITYIFEKAYLQDDDLIDNTINWRIDGFGLNAIAGEPGYPIRFDRVEIPKGYMAYIDVIDSSFVEFDYELAPARSPISNETTNYNLNDIVPISPYQGFRPNNIVEVANSQKYRGQDILHISICPIQYNHTEKKVRAYTKIEYKVSFIKKITETPLQSLAHYGDSTITSTPTTDSTLITPKDYLILSTYEFADAVNRFAEWKKSIGYNVHIGLNNNWQPDSIKAFVKNKYEKYPNLYYLLIIGDHDDVPASFSEISTVIKTDLLYGCMDGDDDLTPDIYRGRIPVSSLDEANIVVTKIINYEKNPPTDTSFYQKGVHVSYFQDNNLDKYEDFRFTKTSEDIRDYLLTQNKLVQRIYFTEDNVTPLYWNDFKYYIGSPIPEELKKPIFSWNGDSSNIINAINNGCFYVLHRGHGLIQGWEQPQFLIRNFTALNNGNLQPIVFSFNCLTGRFEYDCFAENLLKIENGGSVGIFAASNISFPGQNDALITGMFDAIWPDPGLRIIFNTETPTNFETPKPTYQLGQILDQGLMRMSEFYGEGEYLNNKFRNNKMTRLMFHLFGDPSMRIYTQQPTQFSDVNLTRTSNYIEISHSDTTGIITIYDKLSDHIVSTSNNYFKYKTDYPQFITVSIYAHNKIPFVSEGSNPNKTYIQNENITDYTEIESDAIFIGSDVTDVKNEGSVNIDGNNINMSASKYIIKPNTSISQGSNVILNIKPLSN